MMMGVLETLFEVGGLFTTACWGVVDGSWVVGWALLMTGGVAAGSCFFGWFPSVTDFSVIPWYVPMVSILKPSVSDNKNELFFLLKNNELNFTLFGSDEAFLIVTVVNSLLRNWPDRGGTWSHHWRGLWRSVSALFPGFNTLQYGKHVPAKKLKKHRNKLDLHFFTFSKLSDFTSVPCPSFEE